MISLYNIWIEAWMLAVHMVAWTSIGHGNPLTCPFRVDAVSAPILMVSSTTCSNRLINLLIALRHLCIIKLIVQGSLCNNCTRGRKSHANHSKHPIPNKNWTELLQRWRAWDFTYFLWSLNSLVSLIHLLPPHLHKLLIWHSCHMPSDCNEHRIIDITSPAPIDKSSNKFADFLWRKWRKSLLCMITTSYGRRQILCWPVLHTHVQ